MRPTRLFVSGFTAFRDDTEIDFTGTDLFAFSGPTGSGKSSLVDAMVFALYGCVPRLDQRAVAPVISLGRNEARVRLDFTVGDEAYTAARVVRRTKTGATTKEARLERADGEVLAGNEKELTAEVERLLGLGFDHFTTCVVLPQGRFARFLHSADKERQELLVSLLDLGLYRRMAKLAYDREQAARREADKAQAVLDTLGYATTDALAEAEARLTTLVALRADVEQVMPKLDELRRVEESALAAAAEARRQAGLLAGLVAPEDTGVHAAARVEAQVALDRADAEAERASSAAEEAEKALVDLPRRAALEKVLHAQVDRATYLAEQREVVAVLAVREAEVERTAVALADADAAAADAADRLERAQWDHRAHDLAVSLVVGEPCPVCRQVVPAVPSEARVEDVERARVARQQAERAVDAARSAHRTAERGQVEVATKLESINQRLAGLDEVVAGHPEPDRIRSALAEVDVAERVEKAARKAWGEAHQAVAAARKAVEHHDEAETAARRFFDQARDRVAALDPPPAGRHDLSADWRALAEWAAAERPIRGDQVVAEESRAAAASADRTELQAAQAAKCRASGVVVSDLADVRSTVADALATVAAAQKRIQQGLTDAAEHRSDLARHSRSADVAKELRRLLSVSQFEKWVLDETLAGLVAGATSLLCELSGGAYSLALGERSTFEVVDHRNADERRSARTLSGGETFLASLALALALADQIGSLAAGGSARLESIFLDEGFGTLDPDTLDTVASAIEEIGARGRMVGLISHVPELAERVPVRFEVMKGPAGATVTRVAT